MSIYEHSAIDVLWPSQRAGWMIREAGWKQNIGLCAVFSQSSGVKLFSLHTTLGLSCLIPGVDSMSQTPIHLNWTGEQRIREDGSSGISICFLCFLWNLALPTLLPLVSVWVYLNTDDFYHSHPLHSPVLNPVFVSAFGIPTIPWRLPPNFISSVRSPDSHWQLIICFSLHFSTEPEHALSQPSNRRYLFTNTSTPLDGEPAKGSQMLMCKEMDQLVL